MSGEGILAHEVLDGSDMIGKFLRERYRGPYQPGDPWPQRALETILVEVREKEGDEHRGKQR
jgi:hypothetical protein